MTQDTNQKTLIDLCADLWHAKVYILCGLLVALVLAGGFIVSATPYYKARAVLSPANPINGTDVSSLLADEGLFALGSLAQRMGGANSSDFTRFENTYAGPSVAELLIKDPAIREGLMKDPAFGAVKSEAEWNAVRVADYIEERVRLEPLGATPMRRMVYLHPGREFGSYFLQNLHRLTDELIRQKIRQEATQRVRYLQDSVVKTSNPDHKRALTALLMEQERLLMLVSIEMPYAATVVEPPSASRAPAWPDPLLIFPVFALVGMVVGFVIFSIREAANRRMVQSYQAKSRVWFKTDSRNNNEERRVTDRRKSRAA